MFPWFHHKAVDSLQPALVGRQKHRLSLVELLHQLSVWVLDYCSISVNNVTQMLSFHLTWFLLFSPNHQSSRSTIAAGRLADNSEL